jgi:hypothetical protein
LIGPKSVTEDDSTHLIAQRFNILRIRGVPEALSKREKFPLRMLVGIVVSVAVLSL